VGAAIAQPREDFRRTVESTAELLEWLRQESPQSALVAISSAAVYGDGHAAPIAESARLNPYSPYGHHKAIMESMCRSYAASYGLRALVARLFSVYGAGLRKQLLWDMCVKLDSGNTPLELGGTGEETRDWVHVDDVGAALVKLVTHASPEVPVFNVASGRGVPVRSIASIVTSQWRAQGGPDRAPAFSGRGRAGDPVYLVADCAKLSAVQVRCERSLEQSLAEYVAWFRSPNAGAH
jgi:UDP-glucose 4-epimerase